MAAPTLNVNPCDKATPAAKDSESGSSSTSTSSKVPVVHLDAAKGRVVKPSDSRIVIVTGGLFKRAAAQVLRDNPGLLLTSSEICKRAALAGYLTHLAGKTPEATMASTLYRSVSMCMP